MNTNVSHFKRIYLYIIYFKGSLSRDLLCGISGTTELSGVMNLTLRIRYISETELSGAKNRYKSGTELSGVKNLTLRIR